MSVRRGILGSVCLVAAASAPAAAQPLVRASLQAGYAVPLGATEKDIPLRTNAAGQIPFGLDLGVRVARPIVLGVYGQYGAVFARGSNDWTSYCPAGDTCSATDTHLGARAEYAFAPGQRLDPWIALGIGYEWYSLKATRARYTWRGIEVASLQGGLDVALGRVISVGPFLGVSVAQFSQLSVDPANAGFGGPVDSTALHEWFTMGARGSADIL